MTKKLMVGKVAVGGGAPVSIQSMCNTKTDDVAATVAQIHALEDAGCEIIRVAVPDEDAAKAVDKIKEQIDIPLIADIHFNYKLALMCAERGIDALRINPPATSAGRRRSRPWRTFAAKRTSPSASASTAALWKRSCGPSTAAYRRRPWWRAPWAMSGC